MKVFLDTNVLVAAFATRGLCEDVLRTVLAEHELVISETVLLELERTLVKKLKVPASKARAAVLFVREQAVIAGAGQPVDWPVRDPDDLRIVAAAADAAVDVLVTGDKDLLDVASELPISVVSPRGFWESLR